MYYMYKNILFLVLSFKHKLYYKCIYVDMNNNNKTAHDHNYHIAIN